MDPIWGILTYFSEIQNRAILEGVSNLRHAWTAFGLYAHSKHNIREAKGHIDKMRAGTDEMLDVTETVEHVVMGTMDSLEAQKTVFKAFNWAPRIQPTLWRKFPWKHL